MGGNKLKSKTKRISADEYKQYISELLNIFKDELYIEDVKCISSKESFGDIDFFIVYDTVVQNTTSVISIIKRLLNDADVEISINDNVVSFSYKEVQIDFICLKSEQLQPFRNYYSYNILGNITGKLAKMCDLTFGQIGLYHIVRFEGFNTPKQILISDKMEDVCELLDLDFDRYNQGFDTIKDIFDFTTSSKYFNYQHSFDNINGNKFAKRDYKKPFYKLYVTYMTEYKDILSKKVKVQFDKSILEKYTNFSEQYNNIISYYENIKNIRNKFNFEILHSYYPNMDRKELGTYFSKFKNIDNYQEFILSNDVSDIVNEFKKQYPQI